MQDKPYLPKVSIVTTVFNGVEEIENTIISVINQTYEKIEYIIIDGGSNDGTLDIIKKYSNKLSYWISEKDGGIYEGMNKGLAMSSGDWILFRNCGDYFTSLNDVANVFNGTDYRNYDILAGQTLLCDKYGYRLAIPEFVGRNRQMVMPVWHPSTFVKTSLHKEKPFNTRYNLAADHDFFYQCLLRNVKFYYIPVLMSIFNIEAGASVKGQSISVVEHYYIHGGSLDDIIALCILRLKQFRIRIFLFLKQITPFYIMAKRRVKQGGHLWSDNFSYREMIEQAIHNRTTNFI